MAVSALGLAIVTHKLDGSEHQIGRLAVKIDVILDEVRIMGLAISEKFVRLERRLDHALRVKARAAITTALDLLSVSKRWTAPSYSPC